MAKEEAEDNYSLIINRLIISFGNNKQASLSHFDLNPHVSSNPIRLGMTALTFIHVDKSGCLKKKS